MCSRILLRNIGLLICFLIFATGSVGAASENEAVFDIPRLDAITIDGNGDDWDSRGFRVETLVSGTYPIPSAPDFDAAFRLGWERRGLLLLAMVTDDICLESSDEGSLWSRDSVELFMAPTLGATDLYQIVIGPGLDAETPILRYHIYDYRKTPQLLKTNTEITTARTKTPTGYVLEALLPWENLAIKPEVGRKLAFQITINDADSPQDRIQLLWYPIPGAYADSNKMHRLHLSSSPSPAILAAAFGDYERFRRTRISVTAKADLVGKTVEIREEGQALGAGKLVDQGMRASAKLSLPMPPKGKPYGPLTVLVDGQYVATAILPDIEKQRRTALRNARLNFTPFVFSGKGFPPVDFEQPSLVEDLIGRYTLKTTFYDVDYRETESAEEPGRYGAVIEVAAEDGQVFKRFVTLFRQLQSVDWDKQEMSFAVEFPEGLGIHADVIKEQAATVSEYLQQRLVDSFERERDSAVLLAGLYETKSVAVKPNGGTISGRGTGNGGINSR